MTVRCLPNNQLYLAFMLFACSSNSKCVYFTYYQKCSNNNKGCMGYCQLYGAAATSKTYNACHVDNGLGPLCYYQSGKKSSSG